MNTPEKITFLMEPELCESAVAGRHNFIAKVAKVLQDAGRQVAYAPFGAQPSGATLSHMKQPPDAGGLVFRRVYHYPFWQIESTAERWHWDVARATFDPGAIDPQAAKKFRKFWQKRLFGDLADRVSNDGFIYIPLQGRLLDRRSFQHCSPVEMIENCLIHAPDRKIIASLHPKEQYSDVEMAALERLERGAPQLEVRMGGMEDLLPRCAFVVTQNSSVAFNGYFFRKPALLFARIDFHHIAVKARLDNLPECFCETTAHRPDFARYLYWFWQLQSINAGRPEAEERIAARLRRFGWLN
ncbi:hypothetical protein ABMC89_11800 [Sulfitobacter sp. HNIBRBA3233]|uniref:hypothetical protein n=1 Tax=Sulfitobacter marinivivus TaxID=3158558 RepID=UPI0032DF2C5E